jgi:regulator of sigma E protease
MTILLVIAILVLLIVVHELGHFIAAKLFGVSVEEFGVGYPPRAFSFGMWGGTEYTLNWIPFGGFVRLFGDEGTITHGRGSFADASRWKQAIILVAGVSMNVVAAFFLFFGAYSLGILHVVDDQSASSLPAQSGVQLLITDIVPGSPADAAGLKAGDQIVGLVDDADIAATLTPDGVLQFVSSHGGQDLSVTFMHAGATSTTSLTPAHAVVTQDSGRPAIGVGLALVTKESISFVPAAKASAISTYNTFVVVGQGLWTIIDGTVHGAPDLKDVTGPVGLVSVVGEASRSGIGYVLSLAAFISVNLAVINLIPIPALDGGRLVIVALEAIIRRPAPRMAVQTLNALGIFLILLLMVIVTYNDIARLIA